MSQLLRVTHSNFQKEMDKEYEETQEITSLDVFNTFIHTLNAETNLLSDDDLKALVFKQFKEYGDFDKTVQEVAENVSNIKETTDAAINAIDQNDKTALKSAYSQLKDYQKQIFKLEEDMYTDDTTGAYNRKFLFNRKLNKDKSFKTDGKLMHLSVSNFYQINKEHGHASGDAVIKFISKILQKELQSIKVKLIRYVGVQFIALSKNDLSQQADEIFKRTVKLIQSKKFKTHSGEILNIELTYKCSSYAKNQQFHDIYSDS